MSAYLQLGHESWSLLEESDGGNFTGIVLSPVNDSPAYVADRLGRLGELRDEFEVILDPQLYNPLADKGQLASWPYYSSEFATADSQDIGWWASRAHEVVDVAAQLGVEAICTPALFPRRFSDDYYRFVVEIADETVGYARSKGIDTLVTVIVNLNDLHDEKRALEIASILTSSSCDRIYLSFLDDKIPQKEPFADEASLTTAVHLVRLLSADMRVHIAFCSHDLILWKMAGATDVSTGKWMNVRRFSPGRWSDDDSMGRQVPYWNEGPLLTLIRDQDVLRLDRANWFDHYDFSDNPASEKILEILLAGQGDAWQKLSWLQYLRWVTNSEARWEDFSLAEGDLFKADSLWGDTQKMRILFTDRFNTGDHVRYWLNAIHEGLAR